jgi:D-aminoacyl-tRNA deacylase
MIALLQRVREARVEVDGRCVAAIGPGLLVFVGVSRGDREAQADRLLERVLGYRVFADHDGKMNLSLRDTGGGLLLVPQFTLAADTCKGMRASFTPAAEPGEGKRLYDYLLDQARHQRDRVEGGVFGADMQVTLTNDGPVTFWLEAK